MHQANHHQAHSQIAPVKKIVRKKHWPLNFYVQLPNIADPVKIETNTGLKVKNLKDLIKNKSPKEA